MQNQGLVTIGEVLSLGVWSREVVDRVIMESLGVILPAFENEPNGRFSLERTKRASTVIRPEIVL